ncbi:hypothetical protein [Mycolicibacterium arseniciresistens]|uniref:Uncharacterized protein n=1 Tax=Mycolicibacterium arseniciresistens TaxID=3062257 RepID=A0ABT8UCP3_9MYCO|nr:hypothetical protein [Mycolicibacterium arseniciresistens]MDO3635551.1 hypothetical protein [Mycolicibacterium arseniciresistens]
MTRRGWWLAGGVVVVVAAIGIVLGVVLTGERSSPDCDAVRAVGDEAERFHDAVAKEVNGEAETPATEYDDRIERITAAANTIRDEGLARRAHDVAGLADRTAALVLRERTADFAADFSRVGAEFNANLMALSQACPDPGDRIRIGAPG